MNEVDIAKKKHTSPTKVLTFGIVLIILIGTIMLHLPICSKTGRPINIGDSFFISTSAVCVTGLTPVVIAEELSVIGQIVLLVLIQVGGLGLMTFIALVLMIIGKKLNLSDRLIIKESLNQNNFSGMVALIRKITIYTIIFEAIGAICLGFRFVPEFGLKTGIYYSVFHAVSSFCNAGFDILGNNSLMNYSTDLLVNLTVMSLITVGGLGFTVWDDIFKSIQKHIKSRLKSRGLWRELSLHTKFVITMSLILFITGTVFICCLEYNNIETLDANTLGEKVLKSSFQSVTLRTAGYTTIDQNELTTASKFVSICYMFVGGSPASTSGGIKTVTLGVIILLVINFIKGDNTVDIFGKNISEGTIKRSIVIFAVSIFIVIVSIIMLLITESSFEEENLPEEVSSQYTMSFIDVAYEVVSAFGTVGLTLDVTSKLSGLGKLIITVLMIIGRLGPITISMALFQKHKEKKEKAMFYSPGNLLVG